MIVDFLHTVETVPSLLASLSFGVWLICNKPLTFIAPHLSWKSQESNPVPRLEHLAVPSGWNLQTTKELDGI